MALVEREKSRARLFSFLCVCVFNSEWRNDYKLVSHMFSLSLQNLGFKKLVKSVSLIHQDTEWSRDTHVRAIVIPPEVLGMDEISCEQTKASPEIIFYLIKSITVNFQKKINNEDQRHKKEKIVVSEKVT